MRDFEDIFKKHKAEILAIANANTHLNADGLATISRADDWFYEDIWEQDYAKMKGAS